MNEYVIQTEEMNRIMELLFHVLDIRITFFDLREEEVASFHIKEMSSFCREHRKDPLFHARCVECDRLNLARAKQLRDVHIYCCHAGLLEGIVPLYNRRGSYLGAIVYGQLANRKQPIPDLRISSCEEMHNIGNLLKYLAEYICENEVIRQCAKPWSILLEEYISKHLSEPLTLRELAKKLGRSESFLSHNIPGEFGMPFKAYLRKKKMERARALLLTRRSIAECAFELGYYDAFYFSKEFKVVHGLSPSLWRRQYRKSEGGLGHDPSDLP